jgi:hypothetical protein
MQSRFFAEVGRAESAAPEIGPCQAMIARSGTAAGAAMASIRARDVRKTTAQVKNLFYLDG